MQPIKSNITSTGKCLNPVTTKCVVWDGPDITCLDGTTLCKGQNVETTLYTLATKLCEIYTALSLEDINTCINNIIDSSPVSISSTSSIKEVFSAIIEKICLLNGRVQNLEDTPCLEQTGIVPECLRTKAASFPGYDSANHTLPLQYYAELVGNSVCGLLIDITALQSDADTINQQIDDLWLALQGCSASAAQNYVLPTCTYNWSVSPNGDPVSIQTAYSWLEADYCTLRNLLGSNSEITSAINSQCANLGNENTLAPGLAGTMSTLPGWSDNPVSVANTITNMWLTVCDMRSYISDVLSLCCKSMCDYLQVGFTPLWSPDGTKVKISFVQPTNPVIYEDGNIPPAPTSPFLANGIPGSLPPWALAEFPTASQTNVQFILDDGNGYAFTVSSAKKINTWAQLGSTAQYEINFPLQAPSGYDQTSINQTINISFTYDVVIGSTTKTCTFDTTLALPYICYAPKPYNCNGELEVSSSTGTDMLIKLKDLVGDTPIKHSGTVTSAGSGSDTLQDTGFNFTGLTDYVVTVTSPTGDVQCRYILNTVGGPDQIQLDSNWTTPIAAGDTYEIKNQHYSYAQWGPLGVTSFNITVSTKTSNFDINDSSTWNTQQTASVPPTVLGTSGYQIANGVLQGNTEYVVIISAVYPCGESELVSTENYNQVAASVHVQEGNTNTYLIGVLDASVTVTNVESDGTLLSNGFASTVPPNTDALYALALPQSPNVTQLAVTPSPANWLLQPNGDKYFCVCGINTDPDGFTPPSSTTPNHDVIIGRYRGYDVQVFKLDNLNNYIPVVDSNNAPYKTNSLADPTLSFNVLPTPNVPLPPIVIDVPSTYSYSKLPVVVRYDPTPYQVNTSPVFHTIRIPLVFGGGYTNSSGVSHTFGSKLVAEVFRWDTTTNQYVSYNPKRRMEFATGAFVLPPGGSALIPLSSWTYTNTDPNSPGPGELSAAYGDALRVYLLDNGIGLLPFDPPSNHQAILNFDSELTSRYSCRIPAPIFQHKSGNMQWTTYTAADPNPWWYMYSKAIITEDYVVTPSINSQR